MKKIVSLLLTIALILVEVNCSISTVFAAENTDEYKFKYENITEEQINNDIYLETTLNYNSDVSKNFGDTNYTTHHFRYTFNFAVKDVTHGEMKVDIRGILGLPVKEQMVSDDLVVLLHGRMGSPPNSEYGFSYLVDYLASNGYRAVSISLSDLYMMFGIESEVIPQAVTSLVKQLNMGSCRDVKSNERVEFGSTAKNIYLLGHSRAGYHVFKSAEKLIQNKINVKHIISIAPCIVENFPNFDTDTNVDTTFIIPEFDGDVSELSGSDMYNILSSKQQRSATDSLYYVFAANHNYFNTCMVTDDGAEFDDIRGTAKLSRVNQMQFLMGVLADIVLDKHEEFLELVYPIRYTYRIHKTDYVNTVLSDFWASGGSSVTDIFIDRCYGDSLDTVFREPGYNKYKYKRLKFGEENSEITLDIENLKSDNIVLDLALDSTTFKETGLADSIIYYTITLFDNNGDIVETYRYNPIIVYGETHRFGDNSRVYSHWTPIEQLSIRVPHDTVINKIVIKCNYTSDLIIKNIYTENM